jgi:hypothetical protein
VAKAAWIFFIISAALYFFPLPLFGETSILVGERSSVVGETSCVLVCFFDFPYPPKRAFLSARSALSSATAALCCTLHSPKEVLIAALATSVHFPEPALFVTNPALSCTRSSAKPAS